MPVFVGAGTSSFMKDTDGVGISQRTTTQINNMTGMVAGQIAYDTDIKVLKYYDGSSWLKISSLVPTLTSVTGVILAGAASTLTLTGTNFLNANLVVNFLQTSDNVDVNVTVTPASDTSATVTVPATVYNNVTAGNAVTIKVTNSDFVASNTQNITVTALPSGGNITTSGGYRIHTFTSSANFVFTLSAREVQYLIVAGGGGGGGHWSGDYYNDGGGGGGAGGYRTNVTGQSSGGGSSAEGANTVSPNTYSVVVGAGGASSSTANGNASNGNASSVFGISSVGGGGGAVGTYNPPQGNGGNNGGCGGGCANAYNTGGSGGSGTSGQGYRGGNHPGGALQTAGGGGGAGAAGGNAAHRADCPRHSQSENQLQLTKYRYLRDATDPAH